MKKLMAIALAVALVITAFAMVGSVSAGPPANPALFEANIVARPHVDGWSDVPSLDEGEVKVFADGSVELKIKGAEPFTTYNVYFGQASPPGPWTIGWTLLDQFPTDGNGDGEHTFDPGTISTPAFCPVFAINMGTGVGSNKYITGF